MWERGKFLCVRGVKSRNLLGIYDKGYDKWLGKGNFGERQVWTGIEEIGCGRNFWDGVSR